MLDDCHLIQTVKINYIGTSIIPQKKKVVQNGINDLIPLSVLKTNQQWKCLLQINTFRFFGHEDELKTCEKKKKQVEKKATTRYRIVNRNSLEAEVHSISFNILLWYTQKRQIFFVSDFFLSYMLCECFHILNFYCSHYDLLLNIYKYIK